jgi:hypothetical protein
MVAIIPVLFMVISLASFTDYITAALGKVVDFPREFAL